jgi:hypothetical protein
MKFGKKKTNTLKEFGKDATKATAVGVLAGITITAGRIVIKAAKKGITKGA